jgi:hypothetical protein
MSQRRSTIRHVERLEDTAPRALRLALAQQPNSPGKILFAWTLAAGPALSRAATASWVDGTLVLVAKSETWRRELLRARPQLVARLELLLGPGIVRKLAISGTPGRER